MIRKIRMQAQEGFTLIELMIVIAIIGILAAIAIPNFIAYRNKSFCSAVESDANGIAAEIADYFSVPTHTAIETDDIQYNASNGNAWEIAASSPNSVITIVVTDGSSRCPTDYQVTSPYILGSSGSRSWSNASPGVYTKVLAIGQ